MAKRAPARTTPIPDVARQSATSAARTERTPVGPPAATRTIGPIKVRATVMGYYDNERKRPGDVFAIKSPREFSKRWMEHVAADTPERTTGPNEALRQQHDEILAARHGAGEQVGPDDVPANIEDDGSNPLGAE